MQQSINKIELNSFEDQIYFSLKNLELKYNNEKDPNIE